MDYFDRDKSKRNSILPADYQSEEGFRVTETKLELYEKLEQLKNNKPKSPLLIVKWKKSIKLIEEELK